MFRLFLWAVALANDDYVDAFIPVALEVIR